MPKDPTPKLILASASKARKQLLEKLGLPFTCVTSGFVEDMKAHHHAETLAINLALGKARIIGAKHPQAIIIGADTFVVLDGKKIGKARSITEAGHIIQSMSGKTLEVITGVAILKTAKTGRIIKKITFCDSTKVKVKTMTAQEILEVANHPEALECAGAFSIEGKGKKMVEHIEGDIDTVIGLPIKKLEEVLKKFVNNLSLNLLKF